VAVTTFCRLWAGTAAFPLNEMTSEPELVVKEKADVAPPKVRLYHKVADNVKSLDEDGSDETEKVALDVLVIESAWH